MFDPYHQWLGIPPSEQPPNHYRLLGIALFEPDANVISNAADRQMAHLQTFKTGKYSSQSQQLLNEVAKARVCLLNAAKKAEYDASLRKMHGAATRSNHSTSTAAELEPISLAEPSPPTKLQATPGPLRKQRSSADQQRGLWAMVIPALLLVVALICWAFSPSGKSRRPVSHAPEAAKSARKMVASKPSTSKAPDSDEAAKPKEKPAEPTQNLIALRTPRSSHQRHNEVFSKSIPRLRLALPTTPLAPASPASGSSVSAPSAPASKSPAHSGSRPVTVDRFKPRPITDLMVDFSKFKELRDAVVFRPIAAEPETISDTLQFQVHRAGEYYLAATWKRDTDSSDGQVSLEQLVEQGWENLGPSPWEKLRILLKRTCKEGESFQIKTLKFQPPYLIVPASLWNEGKGSR
jgi:hypothetical protein